MSMPDDTSENVDPLAHSAPLTKKRGPGRPRKEKPKMVIETPDLSIPMTFPQLISLVPDITLRDYFAATCLPKADQFPTSNAKIATACYAMADAMLKERGVAPSPNRPRIRE